MSSHVYLYLVIFIKIVRHVILSSLIGPFSEGNFGISSLIGVFSEGNFPEEKSSVVVNAVRLES